MTPLGKPLVFHLKYMAEMSLLWDDPEEEKKPDLTGLDDAENVRKMVRGVEAAADELVADFLAICALKRSKITSSVWGLPRLPKRGNGITSSELGMGHESLLLLGTRQSVFLRRIMFVALRHIPSRSRRILMA